MQVISGIGVVAPAGGAARSARGPGGFRVATERPGAAAPAAQEVGATEEIGLAGILTLQELPDPALADRQARRRGQDLLTALAELQRDMLADAGTDPVRLAALAAEVPVADDPVLRAAVAAITLRARIEVARREATAAGGRVKSAETS